MNTSLEKLGFCVEVATNSHENVGWGVLQLWIQGIVGRIVVHSCKNERNLNNYTSWGDVQIWAYRSYCWIKEDGPALWIRLRIGWSSCACFDCLYIGDSWWKIALKSWDVSMDNYFTSFVLTVCGYCFTILKVSLKKRINVDVTISCSSS